MQFEEQFPMRAVQAVPLESLAKIASRDIELFERHKSGIFLFYQPSTDQVWAMLPEGFCRESGHNARTCH